MLGGDTVGVVPTFAMELSDADVETVGAVLRRVVEYVAFTTAVGTEPNAVEDMEEQQVGLGSHRWLSNNILINPER